MKIFLLMTIIVCVTFSQTYAGNIYIEGAGSYGDYGDAKKMAGFGVGLGYQVVPRFNAWFHFLNGSATTFQSGEKTAEYEHKIGYVSCEYMYPVSAIPLYWTTSLGAGIPSMKIYRFNNADSTVIKKKDYGFFAGIWTGARYHFTQHVGAFALVGYEMMTQFQNKLSSSKIQGYQFQAGITATVFGKNSPVDDEY